VVKGGNGCDGNVGGFNSDDEFNNGDMNGGDGFF